MNKELAMISLVVSVLAVVLMLIIANSGFTVSEEISIILMALVYFFALISAVLLIVIPLFLGEHWHSYLFPYVFAGICMLVVLLVFVGIETPIKFLHPIIERLMMLF